MIHKAIHTRLFHLDDVNMNTIETYAIVQYTVVVMLLWLINCTCVPIGIVQMRAHNNFMATF